MILRGRVSPLRICDKCGAQRQSNTMRVLAGRWICNWHPHYIAEETLDKVPYRQFPVKPFKGAKPFAPRETFQLAEEELLTFLLENYQYDVVRHPTNAPDQQTAALDVQATEKSTGVFGAGWTGIYLYELIREGRRPRAMLARARSGLREIADWLLSRIVAYPGDPNGFSSDDDAWGGFEQTGLRVGSGLFYAHHVTAAAFALLRAYQVHGDSRHLEAARAASWFLRSLQCGDKLTALFTSSDAAGTQRLHRGAFSHAGSIDGQLFLDHRFYAQDLWCTEFLRELMAVVGDEVIGSAATGGATSFSESRAAPISTCIAEALAFWSTGAADSGTGTVINGLSTDTPREYYDSYPVTKGWFTDGTGAWKYSATDSSAVTGMRWAMALRALRAAEGDSSRVTGLFDWLMTFVAKSAWAMPDETVRGVNVGEKRIWDNQIGAFDPRISVPATMKVVGGLTDDGAYHLGATGLISELYSSRQRASFGALKSALSMPRPGSRGGSEDNRYFWLANMGRCGLSFQPRTGPGAGRRSDIHAAAMAGLVFRQEPKAFMNQGPS